MHVVPPHRGMLMLGNECRHLYGIFHLLKLTPQFVDGWDGQGVGIQVNNYIDFRKNGLKLDYNWKKSHYQAHFTNKKYSAMYYINWLTGKNSRRVEQGI